MATPPPGSRGPVAEVEAWFVRRGVPHLIHEYSATRDIFTRASGVLTLIFVAEVFGAANLDWPWWANVLALPAGLAALLGAWALANRRRARPLLARPVDVGVGELATFVLAPAALPVIFGGDLAAGAWTALANSALLVMIYLVTSYGLVPLTRWATVQLIRQLGSAVSLTIRALPLMLVFGIVLIINTEVWQMSAGLDTVSLTVLSAMFIALGTGLLVSRIPREIRGLGTWSSPAELERRIAETPARHLHRPAEQVPPPALSKRHWANLGLVLLFVQGLQVLIVAVIVGGFFAGFGAVAITAETAQAWIGADLDVFATVALGDREIVLSVELIKVSVVLASVSGLYFAVNAATDGAFRQEFVDDVLDELRQVLAVRAAYHAALTSTAHLRAAAVNPDRRV